MGYIQIASGGGAHRVQQIRVESAANRQGLQRVIGQGEGAERETKGQSREGARGAGVGAVAGGSISASEGFDAEKREQQAVRRGQEVRRVACCTRRPRVRKLINKSAKERSAVAPDRP